MADDDKGWLMVASEQKRFAENLTIVREPEGQLQRITKAESQVNVIGEEKMETVSNEWK